MNSNDPRDKLMATLNHDWPDQDFPPKYREACRRWFIGLSSRQRKAAIVARAAFNKGDEPEAKRIIAALPPAPNFPNEG